MRRKIYFLLFFFLCLTSIPLAAQDIEIKGMVTEATTNEPLPGVTVRVKGKDTGTVTNMDGKYSITAPADGILVFSFVGMEKQEIPVKGRNNILVTMRSSSVALSDVVVIGYGKQSKAALTSAITKVDSKDMAISPTGNPMSMLQGKVNLIFHKTRGLTLRL